MSLSLAYFYYPKFRKEGRKDGRNEGRKEIRKVKGKKKESIYTNSDGRLKHLLLLQKV